MFLAVVTLAMVVLSVFGWKYYLFPFVQVKHDGVHILQGYFKGFHPWSTIRGLDTWWWLFGTGLWVDLRNGSSVFVSVDHPWKFAREVRKHLEETKK